MKILLHKYSNMEMTSSDVTMAAAVVPTPTARFCVDYSLAKGGASLVIR